MEARRIRRALAWPPGCKLSVDQVYDLILSETGDAGQASSAASDYAASQLRKGQTPE